jgi:histidinol-phosphate phosphatase family protein
MSWNVDASWTLFLDRDGVINERILSGYVTSSSEFRFTPGAPEAIARLSCLFKHVFVVTNQQGIAKGLMTEKQLQEIHIMMHNEVEKVGGKITQTYYAPGISSPDNQMRKPNPGMAYQAKRHFPEVDFTKSVMVGDTDSDMLFGQRLGMRTVRIKTVEPIHIPADLTVNNLTELLNFWS